MGIKGLNSIINKYAPSAISSVSIEDLCGSKIAIDSEILIHKFRSSDNSRNSHIFGLLGNVFGFLKHGIIPVYIFDGAPSIAKQKNVLHKRHLNRENLHKKAEQLEEQFIKQLNETTSFESIGPEINETLDQLLKVRSKVSTVTKDHKKECKYLLKLLGIPYIIASEDAEALCVALQFNKVVDYVYSEDTDVMPYFASCYNQSITDNVIILRSRITNTFETVDLQIVLKELELTPKQFVDMCILSGCDFCEGIAKIGPMKAFQLIKEYISIECTEGIIDFHDKFTYQEARDIFYKNHNTSPKIPTIEPMNIEGLKTYLVSERNLDPLPIIDKYNRFFALFKDQMNKQGSVGSVTTEPELAVSTDGS
jgi:flap endonuclease-1